MINTHLVETGKDNKPRPSPAADIKLDFDKIEYGNHPLVSIVVLIAIENFVGNILIIITITLFLLDREIVIIRF